MHKTSLWCIPCAFFVVTCVLNLVGKGCGLPELASTVKPALMPLLAVTTVLYLLGGHGPVNERSTALLVTAQLLGFAGDTLLIPNGFFYFAGGMVAFLLGHVCYMCLFGGQSWKGLGLKQWTVAIAVMAGATLGLVKLIGIKGAMFWPMLVYGFGLMMLIFSTLAGVVRQPADERGTWWILLAGALLFTFSDSLIAMETFDVLPFTSRPMVIMLTYLVAQSLLAIGGIRLAQRR